MFSKKQVKNKLKKFNLKKKLGLKMKKVFKKSTDLFFFSVLLILLTDMFIIYEASNNTDDTELVILSVIKGVTSIMLILGYFIGYDYF